MTHPPIEAFVPYEITGKPWGEERVVIETEHYLGKILTMKAGHRGGLQYHERKDEAFYLFRGRAIVRYDNGKGELAQKIMIAGQTFHVPPGCVHQVVADSDCIFFECSTPVFDDRVNVAEQYGVRETGQSQ